MGRGGKGLYEEKKAKGEIPIKPFPEGVNCDIDRAPAAEQTAPKPSDLIIGTIALVPAALVAAKKVRNELKKPASRASRHAPRSSVSDIRSPATPPPNPGAACPPDPMRLTPPSPHSS